MRIVAGIYGGRKLHVPKGYDVRPTSDKVRGAVMNALASRGAIDGAVVLDVFCGTGALGLEALSRGAAVCTFIDKARSSLDLARKNAADLGADNAQFLLKEAQKISARPETQGPASLVFLDPPYNKGLIQAALGALQEGGWFADEAMIVAESEAELSLSCAGFRILDEKIYKDTKITYALYSGMSE
ncbi:MAG: 16S rRNA (guanine(966)-N(2))-methyltransferase RsmD [Alphaproteobacteria bacterium]|nr:16S rRNA (guanine(966)-N(2))-methyltransferase RsmD [Alphaproteobacteria bacterium]